MPCQGSTVSQDGLVMHKTIMGNMRVCHEQVIVTDPCNIGATWRTTMQGDIFTNSISVTDNKLCRIIVEL